MRIFLIQVTSLILAVVVALISAFSPSPALESTPGVIAIRNVTVIRGDGTGPISDATVLIRDDHIAAVGPSAETVIPTGVRVIEGRGKFLVPGFIEMHAHLSKARASALSLFIANGVTTVRDTGGDHEELLRWRSEIRSGKRVGPRMFIAGPYLESARNIERMRTSRRVQRSAASGFAQDVG